MWYIDKNSSQMKVRILGIAPIVDEVDENGNVLYQRVLFLGQLRQRSGQNRRTGRSEVTTAKIALQFRRSQRSEVLGLSLRMGSRKRR